MKRSRRELSIDMVVHMGIFKNNQITFFHCFTFIPKTGVSFNCNVRHEEGAIGKWLFGLAIFFFV